MSGTAWGGSLLGSIFIIIVSGSQKQMRRIAATRVVSPRTVMENALAVRNWAVYKLPAKAMRQNLPTIPNVIVAISTIVFRSIPNPTGFRLYNLTPEPLLVPRSGLVAFTRTIFSAPSFAFLGFGRFERRPADRARLNWFSLVGIVSASVGAKLARVTRWGKQLLADWTDSFGLDNLCSRHIGLPISSICLGLPTRFSESVCPILNPSLLISTLWSALALQVGGLVGLAFCRGRQPFSPPGRKILYGRHGL